MQRPTPKLPNPFRTLHPTLKKCRCGYVADKGKLYRHFDEVRSMLRAHGDAAIEFFVAHGEVPYYTDNEPPTYDHTEVRLDDNNV